MLEMISGPMNMALLKEKLQRAFEVYLREEGGDEEGGREVMKREGGR